MAVAEVSGGLSPGQDMVAFLADFGIEMVRTSPEALSLAGRRWRQYLRSRGPLACPSCGSRQNLACNKCAMPINPRQHLVADFLIGAHALVHSGRLLTRDRGYYRTYFPELTLV
jgi:predicted nucleic acid-binding protein